MKEEVMGGEPVRLILGSGRSGTTWIQDSLANANDLRPVFEPLKSVSSKVPQFEYAFLDKQHQSPELKSFLSDVFNGQFRSIWSDYRMIPDRVIPSLSKVESWESIKAYRRHLTQLLENYRMLSTALNHKSILVKFIRANLMLSWLQANFDTRIALILRHPGAVIESQLRLGGESWDPVARLSYYRHDSQFEAGLGERYGRYLKKDLSPAQMNTLIWAIENQYPLEQAESETYRVFCYESLVNSPLEEWPKLTKVLDLKNVPQLSDLVKPSQQASSNWESEKKDYSKSAKWMSRISDKDRDEADIMLRMLGVRRYSMDDPNPKPGVF
ncbi:hypothetical protein FT643_03255 [Ketobacter sp. MCCC 1A13808]|uniref:hypothetical protein n=1 Tax=Ketobacter sp. MCCC 1A13808 TaxID=2602738 RepID=UPI0012EC4398|nr:hypothetical protein [Ketobacter sp. MCCC 1A13808]MVF11154.1 hypothetical protein [Ketobacter sp. MCCC 1A13808]